MNELEKALDDLDGLHEAYRALSDTERSHPLVSRVSNAKLAKTLRQDLASGADAYAATLMSSARGEVDAKRLRRCRDGALSSMPSAVSSQKRLAGLVEERRVSSPAVRRDVERLLMLSLHCRSALAALAPTVDRRAAEALGNKVLVGLRAATLLYLATVRAGDGSADSGRSAVLESLKRIESQAGGLAGLGPQETDASLGTALAGDVVKELHELVTGWESAPSEVGAVEAA
jgi:hypothetical protein